MARGSVPKRIRGAILHALFPTRCGLCGEIMEHNRVLCKNCEELLVPHKMPTCHKCGAAVSDHDQQGCNAIVCPVISAYYYGGYVRRFIIDFKDHMRDDLFDAFYQAVAERVAVEYAGYDFDMTASVPSYEKKRYSTSETMAKELARGFMIDYRKDLLVKYRKTEKQHMLSKSERETNLSNSITFNEKQKARIDGKTILLCDDVKSTGNTLNECAKALYEAGAKQVCAVCIATSDYVIRNKN